jgi:DNA helicase-2/ATP-dependent DNA helicase PcrA
MRDVQLIFGPPGTGKTTTLLNEVDQLLEADTPPDRVAFFSFSRRAVFVARKRAEEKFDLTHEHLPWFKTIHSVAFRLLELTRQDVFHEPHLADLGERIGLPFTNREQHLADPLGGTLGDRCLLLHGLARARCTTLEYEWRRCCLPDTPWRAVQSTVGYYEQYKQAHGLWDFADMLSRATGHLDVDAVLVDESQDCSTAQWAFLRRVTTNVQRIYLAGDDDQAIYGWSGADPGLLLRLEGTQRVLPHSYRLPRRIKARADTLIGRILSRVSKEFSPRDADGTVSVFGDLDSLNLHEAGTWMLLARTNHQLSELRDLARRQSVVYSLPNHSWSWSLPSVQAALAYEQLRKGHPVLRGVAASLRAFTASPVSLPAEAHHVQWDDVFPGRSERPTWLEGLERMPPSDREYIRGLRRGGESLTNPGRVYIGTVHSMKGEEADHVVILPDLTEKVDHGRRVDPDSEHRVQYVALTRARQTVRLMLPRTPRFWEF